MSRRKLFTLYSKKLVLDKRGECFYFTMDNTDISPWHDIPHINIDGTDDKIHKKRKLFSMNLMLCRT
jgi:hypothetical protein